MRTIPSRIWELWQQGGPFVGDNRPTGRVTVEPDWYLHDAYDVATTEASKLPFRWFQRIDNSQTEVEVPNIRTITIERSLDSDAATCEIAMFNTEMEPNESGSGTVLGRPGHFTWREQTLTGVARWGSSDSDWADILVPEAMLRTYQGFGDPSKALEDALADGDVILTGLWLIDDVDVGSDGLLHMKCRDMAKLLIEQPLYPPFVPPSKYPLVYERWHKTPFYYGAVPVYDSTDPVEFSPDPLEGPKFITDIAMSSDNKGYWLVGTDGGVFAYGVPFYGSRGGAADLDASPMVGIAADPLGRGYWLCSADGGVFAFGEAGFYGSMHGETLAAPITKIVAHPSGRGYWLLGEDGGVFAFGTATFEGSLPDTEGYEVVDMACTPTGDGYWLVDSRGGIFAYGDAGFYGNFLDMSSNQTVSIAAVPDGTGYWVTRKNGDVSPFGSAASVGANGPWVWDNSERVLNDPIFAMSAAPQGQGYVLVGGDGGVFSFGTAPFWGSLPGSFAGIDTTEGNYTDYMQIVKDVLLWAGWLAYGTGADDVYGNLETTGAWAEDQLPADMFDKKPAIDPINQIKEVVGYHFWIDDEGAARFEWPNWYSVGNRMDTGERTRFIPEIDERVQLTDARARFSGKNWRSEIIITTHEPTAGFETTKTTRYRLPETTPDLNRGIHRPAMWTNENFTNADEQQKMAELVGLHILRSLRQDRVVAVANPAIQINDQVRLFERNAAETYIHYVRGITTEQDLDAGTYVMNLVTNWLADDPTATMDGVISVTE